MATLQLNPHSEVETAPSIKTLSFADGDFVARHINSADRDDVDAYQSLRHEWFVQRRGWVSEVAASPGRETDNYDGFCHHLGVFQKSSLVAYLRALPWQPEPGLMLQNEFRDLLRRDAESKMSNAGSVEISRLIVQPAPGSDRSESVLLAEMLFKLFYCLSKRMEWRDFYIVLEQPWLRVLNRRFCIPFAALGEAHTYPDGTRTLAAHTTIDAMESNMLAKAPGKYHWYRNQLAPELR